MKGILRAAIIGTGRIGSTYDDEVPDPKPAKFYRGSRRHNGLYTVLPINHAASYSSLPEYRLMAGANRGEAKLKAFGERYGVRALYTDFRAMLREEQPDVVSVCTQSAEKAEITVEAAQSGVRAIVVEKAMATSMAEADAMVRACEENGVLLAVNHPNRFSLANREVCRRIAEGEIGEVGTVMAQWASGMLHGGTHSFDLVRFLAGDVAEIEARVPDYEPGKDLPAEGMMWFVSGAAGFFSNLHGLQPGLEVRGKRGHLMLSTMVGDGWHHRVRPFFEEGERRYPHQVEVEPIDVEPDELSPTQRLLREVHAAVTEGAPLVSSGRDGAAALELGLACFVSHLAGGAVGLPLADRDFRVPNR